MNEKSQKKVAEFSSELADRLFDNFRPPEQSAIISEVMSRLHEHYKGAIHTSEMGLDVTKKDYIDFLSEMKLPEITE